MLSCKIYLELVQVLFVDRYTKVSLRGCIV